MTGLEQTLRAIKANRPALFAELKARYCHHEPEYLEYDEKDATDLCTNCGTRLEEVEIKPE